MKAIKLVIKLDYTEGSWPTLLVERQRLIRSRTAPIGLEIRMGTQKQNRKKSKQTRENENEWKREGTRQNEGHSVGRLEVTTDCKWCV